MNSQPSWKAPLRRLAAVAVLLAPLTLRGQEPAKPPEPTPTPAPWYQDITVNGFVSAAYSYNFNTPDSKTNTLRVFDFDDNTFKVDVAEVVIQKAVAKPGEAGFRVDVVAGGSIPRVSAAAGLFAGQDFDLQQAFVSWIAPVGRGLRLDLGKFVTHHGVEVIEGYDGWNDNYTHSFLFGYAIPFTHTGLRATYAFSDSVTGMFLLANGWDNVKDNNRGKTLGAQLIVTPNKVVTLTLNYCGGPERADSSDLRHLFDVVAVLKPSDQVSISVDYAYGTEKNGAGAGRDARWQAIQGGIRFSLSGSFALIARGEWFEDRDGARTGTAQKLTEVTITPEIKITDKLIFRADLRLDHSNEDVFQKEGRPSSTQTTLAFNALYAF